MRAPEGNGCAERFIRTLKENLLSGNTTWLIERHGFPTPAAVRQNQLSPAVMAA